VTPSFVTCSSGKPKRKREFLRFVYGYHLKYPRFVYMYRLKYLRFHLLIKYPRCVYAYLRRNHPRRNHPRGNHPRGKFPFGKKKKSRKKTPKKSMIVRIPLEKLRSVTPVKKTKTLADLKLGLAQKKMERAMRGPMGSSRTSDTMPNVIPFTPLAASTPKTKHRCSQCGVEFNMKPSLDHHMKTVHQGNWPRRLLN
jgi:hypothetical protein